MKMEVKTYRHFGFVKGTASEPALSGAEWVSQGFSKEKGALAPEVLRKIATFPNASRQKADADDTKAASDRYHRFTKLQQA